mgnify:CR=1 FL=1
MIPRRRFLALSACAAAFTRPAAAAAPQRSLSPAGRAAAVVTNVGAPLSHAAIVARELGVAEGDKITVDLVLESADPATFDALVLPGGVANPDALRLDEDAVTFVKNFVASGKPVAAICHAPWVLVEADVVRGKRLASFPSLQTDIRNAGGEWVDETVVVDGNLITSRNPGDLEAFNRAIADALS